MRSGDQRTNRSVLLWNFVRYVFPPQAINLSRCSILAGQQYVKTLRLPKKTWDFVTTAPSIRFDGEKRELSLQDRATYWVQAKARRTVAKLRNFLSSSVNF